jgi:hypothetical protein
MTRNYADMLWSAYNFWCKVQYDGFECDSNTKWVKPEYHKRSARAFHDIVLRDMNNSLGKDDSPLHADMSRPYANAGGYFSEYMQFSLWRDVGGKFSTRATDQAHTLVVASEDLESDAMRVWRRVALYFHINRRGGGNVVPGAGPAGAGSADTVSTSTSTSTSTGTGISLSANPNPNPNLNDVEGDECPFKMDLGNFSEYRTNAQDASYTSVRILLYYCSSSFFSCS